MERSDPKIPTRKFSQLNALRQVHARKPSFLLRLEKAGL